MKLTPIERTPAVRPVGAELVPSGANRVIPVPPVNPVKTASAPTPQAVVPTPSVVYAGSASAKATDGEAVYASVSDPMRRGTEASSTPKDWTITRPEPVKEETPPPEPLSKLLIDFLHTMWRASGSVVQPNLPEHMQKAEDITQDPNATPGDIAKEVLTYSPIKIAKPEKSLSGDSSNSATTP
jgi:hypothetical protein